MTGLVLLGCLGEAGPTQGLDRLDRFRVLGRQLQEAPESARFSPEAIRDELLALVDGEVIENLGADGPFAAPEFIRERLEGLADAWGGAAFQVQRLAAPRGRPAFLVVSVSLAGPPASGSLRVYGGPPGDPRLLHAETRAGRPHLGGWPASRAGAPQLAVAWDDPAAAATSPVVDIAVWRFAGTRAPARVWRGPAEGLEVAGVWEFSMRPGEITVRYETRYAGWKPGCEGQTEHEDVYRAQSGGDRVGLARRRVVNGWHRELSATVARFLAAVEGGDRRTLEIVVPDASLRRRLPAAMRPEAACDMPGDRPGTVVVAATAGERAPWSLTWRRGTGGWRLSAAGPVLQ